MQPDNGCASQRDLVACSRHFDTTRWMASTGRRLDSEAWSPVDSGQNDMGVYSYVVDHFDT